MGVFKIGIYNVKGRFACPAAVRECKFPLKNVTGHPARQKTHGKNKEEVMNLHTLLLRGKKTNFIQKGTQKNVDTYTLHIFLNVHYLFW